jgi:magnesium chelatase subunit D
MKKAKSFTIVVMQALLLASSAAIYPASFVSISRMIRRSLCAVKSEEGTVEKATSSLHPTSDEFLKLAFEDVNEIKKSLPESSARPSPTKLSERDNAFSSAQLFPISLFVGHNLIKQALILATINPRIGGVILYGGHGTGKSALIRTVERLFPVTGMEEDTSGDISLENQVQPKQASRTPVVTVPLNVMEDALIGSVDIEKSLAKGRPVFSPGMLAKAHKGVLYADDINLLEEDAASIIMNAMADGFVKVEREGLSLQYPCRTLLLGTFNPEAGEFRDHFLDRIGIALPANTDNFTVAERVQVAENVEGFLDKTLNATQLKDVQEEETLLREKIVVARKILPQVQIYHDQLLYLCEEATLAGCEGHRGEIFATEIAKASAAFDGRQAVNAQDLQLGALMALVPRGKYAKVTPDDQPMEEPNPTSEDQSPPSSSLESMDDAPDQASPEQDMEQEDDGPGEEDHDSEATQEVLQVPQEFIFGVDSVPLDPKILLFQQWARKGKSGKHSKIFNLRRGRFVKAIFPKGMGQGRIAVGATLRAAAPYQLVRRERAQGTQHADKLVHIRDDDFRIQRLARKAGSLVIFVVDASGSMALNRMGAAKGAAMALLQEAYKSRDQICMIAFHDDFADVIVPPTRSMALTKNRLEAMPCGGGSPLAHALTMAVRTGLNAVKVKQDVARVVIVLLTDGRANVPMYISMGEVAPPGLAMDPKRGTVSRQFLKEEALAIAKQLGALPDFNFLCIDTEDRFVGTGIAKELTQAAQGNYHHLVVTDSRAVTQIAKEGLKKIRAL